MVRLIVEVNTIHPENWAKYFEYFVFKWQVLTDPLSNSDQQHIKYDDNTNLSYLNNAYHNIPVCCSVEKEKEVLDTLNIEN